MEENKDINAIIGKNLLKLRKNKKLTQMELAEKFNYSDKAVCRWECGDTLPDINVLSALCAFYGITLNDLTDEDFYPDTDKSKEKYMFRLDVSKELQEKQKQQMKQKENTRS